MPKGKVSMRVRSLLVFSMMVIGSFVILWNGCSEEDPVAIDQSPPQIEIQSPTLDQTASFDAYQIQGSVDVEILALDQSAIEAVEVWVTYHGDSTSTLIGAASAVAGAENAYFFRWNIEAIRNGTRGVLWVSAVDALGNRGRSGRSISILVINPDAVSPPTADFSIFPNLGTVDETFQFNPSHTTDDVDPASRIKVRWDYNGDGVWDTDTSATDATASNVQEFKYTQPDTYLVKLEAYNTYHPDPGVKIKPLIVNPEGGIPRPPAETVYIPQGVYPLGVVEVPGGQDPGYASSELVDSLLYIRITSDILIDKNEVSNQLYANFLNAARDSGGLVDYDPSSPDRVIRSATTGQTWVKLDESVCRLHFFGEQVGFGVDEAHVNDPMTGVTWYGAVAYASFYGLRLPYEAEWEVAARNLALDYTNDGTYLYPWTDPDNHQITPRHANFRESGDPFEESGVTPVGAYNGGYIDNLFWTEDAVGPFGTYDQAGNVAEWVADWHDDATFDNLLLKFQASGQPPVDPVGPSPSEGDFQYKVLRGGSFFDQTSDLRATRRKGMKPHLVSNKVGFRTAHSSF